MFLRASKQYPTTKIVLLILITLLALPSNLFGLASYNPTAQQWEDIVTDTNQELTYQYNYTETGNKDAYGYFEMALGSDKANAPAGSILKILSIQDQWNLSSSFGVMQDSVTRDINPERASWSSGNNLNIRFGAQMPVGYCLASISTGGCDISIATLGNNIRSINNGTGNGLITIKAKLNPDWIPQSTSGTVYNLQATQGGQIIHPQGYNINPKSWSIKIDLASRTATSLKLMVNLAGAYNTATRLNSTQLKIRNLLPSQSPYETTANNQYNLIPETAVDWIYLQLFQNNQLKFSKSLILLADGSSVDPSNPAQIINLSTLAAGNYHAVIIHRNHLAISTEQDINITLETINNLDLRTNNNVKGSNQISLGNNQFGLKPGNVNDDLYINSTDRVQVRNQKDAANIYSDYDINLDGQVSSQDRSLSRLGKESVSLL